MLYGLLFIVCVWFIWRNRKIRFTKVFVFVWLLFWIFFFTFVFLFKKNAGGLQFAHKCNPEPVPGVLAVEFYDDTSYEEVDNLLRLFDVSIKEIDREMFMSVIAKANFIGETNDRMDFEKAVSEVEKDKRVERTIRNASISNELTIVFKSQAKVTRRETDSFLESLGFKVVEFIRYNSTEIDVPVGKEKQLINTFKTKTIVKSISNSVYGCWELL